MSLPTTQQVDSWRGQVADRLHAIQAALFDLIDCPTDVYARPRRPSKAEETATDRASDSEGLFQPTKKAQPRRQAGQFSDPVGRYYDSREEATQQALTWLYELVSAADVLAGHLGLGPLDEEGQTTVRPRAPRTRETHSGDVLVDEGMVWCARAIVPAVKWLSAVYDQMADRMRACTDAEVGEHLTEQAKLVRGDLERLEHRVTPPDAPAVCGDGCRFLAGADGWCDTHRPRVCVEDGCKEVVDGRSRCTRCRKRRSRNREQDAA